MSDPNHTPPPQQSSGTGMGIIVGILVGVVAIMAYFMFAGGSVETGGDGDVNISVEGSSNAIEDAADGAADAVEDAADTIGDVADDAADAVEGN